MFLLIIYRVVRSCTLTRTDFVKIGAIAYNVNRIRIGCFSEGKNTVHKEPNRLN